MNHQRGIIDMFTRSGSTSAVDSTAPFGTDRVNNDLVITEGGFFVPSGVYKRTAATRAILSAAHMGQTATAATRAKLSAVRVGRQKGVLNGNFVHGMIKSETYATWVHIKQRCTNPRAVGYKYYGARGITICERWLNSFENFYSDMGDRPPNSPEWAGRRAQYSIDRINNDGNYAPGNCRWATDSEQQRNKRCKRLVRATEEQR